MLGRVLIPRRRIEAVLDRLAEEIDSDLEDRDPVFVGVLKGCVYFLTDLTRRLSRTVEIDFVQLSSYGASTTSSGTVTLLKDITASIYGRDVYVVEDIVDTGTTLAKLVDMLRARQPRSIQIVSLLSKPSRREVDVDIDFLGYEIDDVFVVGYGLDFDQSYRNLPEIHELVPGDEDG